MSLVRTTIGWLALLVPTLTAYPLSAENTSPSPTPANVLSAEKWQRVDASVNRALSWLASQQLADGSFPTLPEGQPGVTCLCALAFMAHGHGPQDGVYGRRVERAIEFALSCQKQNGLIGLTAPDGPQIDRDVEHTIGNCNAYNHGIASLTLAETYGAARPSLSPRIERAIEKALVASLQMQRWPKDRPADRGGRRYLNDYDSVDADLSVSGWELKFLRASRNAGFNVPE